MFLLGESERGYTIFVKGLLSHPDRWQQASIHVGIIDVLK
jgi:hypothetical protein